MRPSADRCGLLLDSGIEVVGIQLVKRWCRRRVELLVRVELSRWWTNWRRRFEPIVAALLLLWRHIIVIRLVRSLIRRSRWCWKHVRDRFDGRFGVDWSALVRRDRYFRLCYNLVGWSVLEKAFWNRRFLNEALIKVPNTHVWCFDADPCSLLIFVH